MLSGKFSRTISVLFIAAFFFCNLRLQLRCQEIAGPVCNSSNIDTSWKASCRFPKLKKLVTLHLNRGEEKRRVVCSCVPFVSVLGYESVCFGSISSRCFMKKSAWLGVIWKLLLPDICGVWYWNLAHCWWSWLHVKWQLVSSSKLFRSLLHNWILD